MRKRFAIPIGSILPFLQSTCTLAVNELMPPHKLQPDNPCAKRGEYMLSAWLKIKNPWQICFSAKPAKGKF
jgi:hypothetical protein